VENGACQVEDAAKRRGRPRLHLESNAIEKSHIAEYHAARRQLVADPGKDTANRIGDQ
jgi:hypothetical protein